MADVKDILNLSTEKTPSKVESILVGKKKAPATQKRKKPEGVPREVFALQESALLGVGTVATAPPPQVPLFKEKRVAETQQKISWVWKGFRNSARRDNAIFKHWVRADDKSEDYKFARYNRKLKLQSYTNDEYTKHFQDPNWTREETDQLFDLCRRFDLRFVIVHDRFEPVDKPKSVEDLKERFYAISSKLLDLHKMPDEDLSTNPLFNYTFNKKQEEERKQQCDKLFLRTAAQVLEEEGLVEQFRRLEGEMKKHNKAKKRIAHLMQYALTPNAAPATPTTPSFSASDYTTPPPQPKSRKRKNHPDDDDEYEPDPAEYEPTVTPGRKSRSVDKNANRFQMTPLTMGTKTAYRVDSALVELGLIRSDSPPVPAPSVTKAINELKQDLVILLDLQKYVSQKEYHLEVIKTHRDMLLKEMQEKNIPIPQLTNTDKNALASSSANVFGLAIGESEDSELLSLEAELFAPPPPSRARTRDKEGKRSYKKHKMVVEG